MGITYDATGNRLVKATGSQPGGITTSVYDVANQLVTSDDTSGTTTYTFDAVGNQQVQQEPTGDRTTNTWDYENRSTLVVKPDSSRVTMTFNPDNLRVEKVTSTDTTKFIWDDENYLLETDASDVTKVCYTFDPAQYGNLISQSTAGNTSYYHFDVLGSTRELTDNTETVTDTFLYDAWGNEIARTGTTATPFRWVGAIGYYFDPETGQFYIRARTYDPVVARWWSVDPLSDGTSSIVYYSEEYLARLIRSVLSTYSYADNIPIRYVDPSGLASCSFNVCSSPVPTVGEKGGHFFIICDGKGYRGGPGRNPDDPEGEGAGEPDCKCRTKGRGQLVGTTGPWDENFIDHPTSGGYDPKKLICTTVKSERDCKDLCPCFGKVLDAIKKCCVQYDALPEFGPVDGNSNSAVAWMLRQCLPTGKPADYVPRDGRLNPGLKQKVPKCVKDKLN